MAEYCEVCSLHIEGDNAYQSHLKGKRHVRNVQFHSQREEHKKRIQECSIYVRFSPKSISPDELNPFFLQFGSIRNYILGDHYVIVEFENSEPVKYLLNNPVSIRNKRLNIKKRTLYNQEAAPVPEKEDVINFYLIRSKFIQEATFDEQLAAFLNAVQLTDIEVQTRYDPICLSLNKIFASVFPKCRAYKFGSSMTGLGFKECDLDIYMDIGKPILSVPEEQNLTQTSSKSSKMLTMEDLFRKVKRVMYRMNKVFTNIRPVLAAKTPIIKFYYVPTNVFCDISFKHGLGVCKSQLTRHCLSLDYRIKPLMILIKYWARQCEISGCRKISNYALVLLVIFYLQQPEPGILPPLMEFQKTFGPIIRNGWQVSFEEDSVLPKITNRSSIPELLQGFFEFYTNFDFKTNVICLLDGLIHTKEELEEIKHLPSYIAQYKEIAETEDLKFNINKSMCIQDPIELNSNVMASASEEAIESFYVNCEISAKICMSARTNNYKDLLVPLFSEVRGPKQALSFTITINAAQYLNVALEQQEDNAENDQLRERKDKLFLTIFNIIKDILERVYKLEVEILCPENETKQQNIEVLSDIHTKKHQELLFHCIGNEFLWLQSKKSRNSFDPGMSALEKEEAVANKKLERYKVQGGTKKLFDFMCKLQKDYNTMQVNMIIINNKCLQKQFNTLQYNHFGKFQKIVRKTLRRMKLSNIL